ncbi:Ig-like domain-containing protein [Paenibacillus silviterrae]|uniref:Ig-like domain-containing protein n=1 Tax=Paenibacillus silviterrae TaxID=3242194 RepID=UPI002543420C|nr:Ig-like domain-containing protein [Paenibacillus chinjuensis]
MRKAKKMTSPIILLAILVSLFMSMIPSVQAAAVTGVILAVGLEAGSTGTLVATIIPANAINKEVTFLSSHPDIATVTGAQYDPATGTTRITVNAITAGNAVITATTADGNKTAVINITVFPPAQPQVPAASLSADGMVKPGSSFTVGLSLNNVTQSVYAEDVTLAYDSNLFD